jgi:multiple sugar transport system substrate-binding protein
MRRIARTSFVLVLAAGLAACGGSGDDDTAPDDTDNAGDADETDTDESDDSDSGEQSTVTMWMYPVIADEDASSEFWSGIEADFEAANPDVDLNIEAQPWDGRQEKITTALASGTGFDIVLLGPDQIPQYVDQGSLLPLDDLVGEAKDAFLPNAVDSLSVDGQLYGVPIYHTVVTPVFNTSLLDAAGITELPTTWEDVKAAGAALAADDIPVLDYPGSPEETLNLTFYPLLWQAGGSVFSEDGTSVAFDGPEGVEALQFLVDLAESGGLPPDSPTRVNSIEERPFAAGEAAMLHVGDLTQSRQVADMLGAENVAVGQPLSNAEQITFGLPGGLVASHAADPDAVAKVLQFMASPEAIEGMAGASGFFPSRTDVTMPDDGAYVTEFADALQYAFPGDSHPQARQVMSILAPQVQGALLGQKSVEDALSDAADEANVQLASAG